MQKEGSRGNAILLKDLLTAALEMCKQNLNFKNTTLVIPQNRQKLMLGLFESRIVFARLYVVLKFYRSSLYTNISGRREEAKNNFIARSISELKGIKSLFASLGHVLTENSIPKPINFVEKIEIPFLGPSFEEFFTKYIPDGNTKIKILGNTMSVLHKDMFCYTIGCSKKRHFRYLKSRICWPKSIKPTNEKPHRARESVLLIQNFLKNPKDALFKIDNFFDSVFSCGIITLLCKNLLALQNLYHFTIYNNHTHVTVKFGELFFERGIYKISFQEKKLIVASSVPVYLPNDFPNKRKFVPGSYYATPHTFAISSELSAPKMLLFSLSPSVCENPDELMGMLRDVTLYTQFLTIWVPIMKAFSYIGAYNIIPELRYDENCSLMSSIVMERTKEDHRFFITIDPATGEPFFSSPIFRFSLYSFCMQVPSIGLVFQVFSSIIDYLFSTTYRVNYSISRRFNTDITRILYRFSFAPDFFVAHNFIKESSNLEIYSQDGNRYYSPYLISLSKIQSPREIVEDAEKFYWIIGDFVFILQLEKYLQKKGYITKRSISSIMFRSEIFDCVKIKAKHGVWTIKIKLFKLFMNSSISVSEIKGNVHTPHSPEIVHEILKNYEKFVDLLVHSTFGFIREITENQCPTIIYNDSIVSSFYTPVDSKNICVDLMFADKSMSIFHNKSTNFKEIEVSSVPEVTVTVRNQNPLKNSFRGLTLTDIPTPRLSAFFVHSFTPLYSLSEKLCSRGWTMIFASLPTAFQLIYHRKYTLSVDLKSLHFFFVCISASLPNGILVIPFVNELIRKGHVPTKKVFRIRYAMGDFLNVLDSFETYIKKCEAMMSYGFQTVAINYKPIPCVQMECNKIICNVFADKVTLLCNEDEKLSNALEDMPKTDDSIRLIAQVSSRHTLATFIAKILTILYKINQEEFENVVETAYMERNTVNLTINGFPFEVNGTTASCGEMSFGIDALDDIEISLKNILR